MSSGLWLRIVYYEVANISDQLNVEDVATDLYIFCVVFNDSAIVYAVYNVEW